MYVPVTVVRRMTACCFFTRAVMICFFWLADAYLDASRREKIWLRSSRDKYEGVFSCVGRGEKRAS